MSLNQFLANCVSDCVDQGDGVARIVRALRSAYNGRVTVTLNGAVVELDIGSEGLFTALCGAGIDEPSVDLLGDIAVALGFDRHNTGAEVTEDGREDLWWGVEN